MIVAIAGPSGVGKTTLLQGLRQSIPDAHLLMSVTTRAPRPSDEPAFEHVSEEDFENIQKNGEFLWHFTPHGKRYGTRKSAVDEALHGGIYISILVIPAIKVLYDYAKEKVIPFYIQIEDKEELHRRFKERGDMSEEEIVSRIAECRSWGEAASLSGVPFIYLDGTKSREELLKEALTHIKN